VLGANAAPLGASLGLARPGCNTRDIIAAMTQQFARIPSDAAAVVREVRPVEV